MNGRERLSVAMRRGMPDGVPVMCQLALGHYFLHSGLDALEVWHSTDAFAEALVRLQRRYGFDGILVNLPGRDRDWRRHVVRVSVEKDRRVVEWADGRRTLAPPDDNPHVVGPDGRAPAPSFAALDPERLFYVEPHAICGVSVLSSFPPAHYDAIRAVRERAGEAVAVHGEVFSPLSQLVELLGVEPALLALVDDPGRSRACLSRLVEGAVALGRGLVAAGADAVLLSSAYAGAGFLSPRHYRDFVLPFELAVVSGIKAQADVPVYTHTCGAIGDRLEAMMDTGTDGIDTLDPPPLGTVDLADARRRTKGRVFLKGNVDPVNVVLRGTPDDVRRAARACLETAAEGGGYVLSTACSVPPHAPPENVAALREAADAFSH